MDRPGSRSSRVAPEAEARSSGIGPAWLWCALAVVSTSIAVYSNKDLFDEGTVSREPNDYSFHVVRPNGAERNEPLPAYGLMRMVRSYQWAPLSSEFFLEILGHDPRALTNAPRSILFIINGTILLFTIGVANAHLSGEPRQHAKRLEGSQLEAGRPCAAPLPQL